jgi:three-Cys-motif partner protein
VKHDLIRHYLGGWFAKLGSWSSRILYVETHAVRGRHVSGDLGSPLVALNTLLTHRHRDRLLARCEFRFFFIERDEANLTQLRAEVPTHLPQNVVVEPHGGDAFRLLKRVVESLRANRSRMAPAFVFVDPFGFKLPGALLRDLLGAGRVELLINLMWREIDMAIHQAKRQPGLRDTLNAVFAGDLWSEIDLEQSFDERADRAVDVLAKSLGGKWQTFLRMLGDNGATRYVLVHLTNHPDGRDLMKECMWTVCPDGGFHARKSDDPRQTYLIEPTPDLRPLEAFVVERLGHRPARWTDLEDAVRPTIWLARHLATVVRQLRAAGRIEASDYSGRFSRQANPRLALK